MKLEDAKVLVVEDSLGMQAYVVHLLQRLNVQTIEVCSNGMQALQSLKKLVGLAAGSGEELNDLALGQADAPAHRA